MNKTSEAGEARQDSPAEAAGRRVLTTAFVRVGPDGYLTVERRDGRSIVLRDVTMRAHDYCGVDARGKPLCGSYGDVADARPGGGPPLKDPAATIAPGPPLPRS